MPLTIDHIISAGTTYATLNNVSLANSNGATFGISGSNITLSYTVPTDYISSNQSSLFQPTSQMSNYLGTDATQSLQFTSQMSHYQLTADNSLSLGTSYTTHTHSQYINTSVSSQFITSQTVQPVAVSGSNGSFVFSTLSLGNSNGFSFYTTNGSIVGSYTAAGGADGYNILAAGTQTANTTGSVKFENSNGMTFGMSNNSQITASYTVPSVTEFLNTSASSLFQLTADNSLSLGTGYTTHTHSQYINTSQSTLFRHTSADSQLQFTSQMSDYQTTGNYLTTQSGQAYSAANGSNTFQTLSIADSNGVSFSTGTQGLYATVRTDYQSSGNYLTTAMASNRGSDFVQANAVFNGTNASGTIASNAISVSVAAPVALTSWTVSDNATSGTVGRLAFTNLNGVTLSLSSGTGGLHTIVGSHNALTSQSNQAFSAGAASSTFQTISFQDTNGVSFSNNAGAIRITHALQFTSNTSAITSNAFNTSGSSNFVLTANSSLLQHTSATSAITSNALNTSASRVINLIAATNTTGGGTASLSSNISFSNANGATFYTSAGNAIALSYTVPTVPTAYVSSINGSSGAISLNVGSSLSASTNGSSITFGLASNITTALQSAGAYLITAMASNRGSDFVQANAGFNGTNASGTIASNAISISVAAQTVQTQNLHNVTLSGNTSGVMAQISSGTWTLAGGNNITLSQNGNAITISGANVGGAQTAISGIIASDATYTSGTVSFRDGNGISWASTTGQGISLTHSLQHLSNTSAITSNAFNTSGSSNFVLTANSSLLQHTSATSAITSNAFNTSGSSNFVLTANSSLLQHTSATSAITSNALNTSASRVINIIAATNNTAGGTASLSSNVSFSAANGITFYTSAGGAVVASYNSTQFQTTGNYLTTARASTDAIGLNTAQTNVTWTVNSAGLSLNAGGYAGTGTTFNGANISGSITQNSAGLQLSMSVAAPGGGVTPVASASNGSFSFTTLAFSNANNVTFGTSAGGIITASVAAPGAAAENNWVNLLGANTAGNTTASGSTIGYSGINLTLSGTNGSIVNISAPGTSSLSATGQVSISVNGSTISIGVPSAFTVSRYNEYKESPMVVGAIGQASLHLQPWLIPNLHMDRVVLHNQFSNATNSSGSFTLSQWIGIYTSNVSTLSLLASTSMSTNFTGSGTAGSYSLYGGIRGLTIGWTNTITEGMYWIGVIHRSTSGGANQTVSQILNSNINSTYSGILGQASNATKQWSLGLGVYTASTTAMPASVAFTQINGNSSVFLRPPSLYFVSGTI